MRSPLFGNALVSTGFGVGGGIVAASDRVAEALGEAACALAAARGCASVELRGGRIPRDWQSRSDVYANFARDLPHGDDAILKAITKRQRAEVRRSLGFGLDIAAGREDADLAAHYRVYSESVRNLGTPVFPRALFSEMLTWFGNDADIVTVRKDGRLVTSVFTFYFKRSAMA